MKRYTVETEMLVGWENCWTDSNEKLMTYATLDAAADDIRDHVIDCINAVEGGDMIDSPEASNFRIVEESDSGKGWEVTAIYECSNPAAFEYTDTDTQEAINRRAQEERL